MFWQGLRAVIVRRRTKTSAMEKIELGAVESEKLGLWEVGTARISMDRGLYDGMIRKKNWRIMRRLSWKIVRNAKETRWHHIKIFHA